MIKWPESAFHKSNDQKHLRCLSHRRKKKWKQQWPQNNIIKTVFVLVASGTGVGRCGEGERPRGGGWLGEELRDWRTPYIPWSAWWGAERRWFGSRRTRREAETVRGNILKIIIDEGWIYKCLLTCPAQNGNALGGARNNGIAPNSAMPILPLMTSLI